MLVGLDDLRRNLIQRRCAVEDLDETVRHKRPKPFLPKVACQFVARPMVKNALTQPICRDQDLREGYASAISCISAEAAAGRVVNSGMFGKALQVNFETRSQLCSKRFCLTAVRAKPPDQALGEDSGKRGGDQIVWNAHIHQSWECTQR